MWEVEFSDEFEQWWDGLTAAEQKSVDFTVSLLQEAGPTLKMPHSSGVETSRHKHMRELRIQHPGASVSCSVCFRLTAGGYTADWRGQDWQQSLV